MKMFCAVASATVVCVIFMTSVCLNFLIEGEIVTAVLNYPNTLGRGRVAKRPGATTTRY